MTESDQENNNYWLKLIRDKKVSPKLWNRFLRHHYSLRVNSLIFDEKSSKLWPDNSEISQKEIEEIEELEKRHGKPPELYNPLLIQPFMNFSYMEFDSEISFDRRVLMGANFRNTVFKGAADFSGTFFLGNTYFNEARFLAENPITGNDTVVSFLLSSFEKEANFYAVQFPNNIRFDSARFNRKANFQHTIFGKESIRDGHVSFYKTFFKSNANFDHSVFNSKVDFSDTQFNFGADFSNVRFNDTAYFDATEFNFKTKFENTRFENTSDFNNAKFRNTLSFSNASFSQPPQFFNSELHEDMNFFGIDWSRTEQSYSRDHRQNDDLDSITKPVDAIRAWGQLAMIMSKQEKSAERHEFFRLKMRAQRQRNDKAFLTFLNFFFEKLSDYGWGVGYAFLWWGLHILLGAIILGFVACLQIDSSSLIPYIKMFGNSLLVSFSNSVTFLGLGTEGGYLYDSSIAVKDVIVSAKWVFQMVGTVQAVLGPILLFLVLLTLRNRFKIK